MLDGLAIVVVNYASAALLSQNVVRVQAEAPEARIVVVDNYSTRAERELIRDIAARHGWALIEVETNSGFGGGVNAGVQHALGGGATDLLLLNPDAWVSRDALLRLADAVAFNRRSMAAPVILTSSGRTWFDGNDLYLADGRMRRRANRARHPEASVEAWLTGACLWITKETWQATGAFEESYFLYWEDVDYSVRAARAGCELIVVANAIAVHDEGGTQAGDRRPEAKSNTYYYYNIRNRLLFAARNFDADTVSRWRRKDLEHARLVLLRGGRGQFLRPWGPIVAATRGILDGRRMAAAIIHPGLGCSVPAGGK